MGWRRGREVQDRPHHRRVCLGKQEGGDEGSFCGVCKMRRKRNKHFEGTTGFGQMTLSVLGFLSIN